MKLRMISPLAALLSVLSVSLAWSQDPIPYVPSTMPVVERMLKDAPPADAPRLRDKAVSAWRRRLLICRDTRCSRSAISR